MRGKKYGLVISNWMTGYDLLKEVRSDPTSATTPFVVIWKNLKTSCPSHVNNYIVKPFERRDGQSRRPCPGHVQA